MDGGKLTMKLSKKVQGEKLISIVGSAMKNLPEYKTSIHSDIRHLLIDDMVIGRLYLRDDMITSKKEITAEKYKENKIETMLQGKWKALYLIPIVGWAMYLKEKSFSNKVETTIKTFLDSAKEYEEVNFEITRENTFQGVPARYKEDINNEALNIHPNVKKDLETLESYITKKVEEL